MAVDGPEFDDVDVRELDLDNYLEQYERKARGHIKTESNPLVQEPLHASGRGVSALP